MNWTQIDRSRWEAHFDGDRWASRIKMLDKNTFSVYRNGSYLNSEPSLDAAQARAKSGKRKASSTTIPPAMALEPGVVKAGGTVIGKVTKRIVVEKVIPKDGKKAELAAMLARGCTREEVLRVNGWKAVDMKQIGRSLGVEVRTDKSVKPFRYYSGGEK